METQGQALPPLPQPSSSALVELAQSSLFKPALRSFELEEYTRLSDQRARALL